MSVQRFTYSDIDLRYPVICVVGPTASGKTNLAQEIALAKNGEVISADSMQVYRGMNIGTGKIRPSEIKVPHHGIDICDPDQTYSAALFQPYARDCFATLEAKGKRSILCGGTGLYVRAAIDDYDFPPGDQEENPVREHYTRYSEEYGALALWDMLNDKDPASAALIHYNNVRRVVRAFEMLDEGTSYAEQHEALQNISQKIPACFLGLKVDPDILNQRIDRRVEAMIEEGLIEEVKSLLNNGFRSSITSPQAIGYKEILEALEGEISLEEAIERIKIATHRYAKKQRTWFRKDKRIHWIDANSADVQELCTQSLKVLEHFEGQ